MMKSCLAFIFVLFRSWTYNDPLVEGLLRKWSLPETPKALSSISLNISKVEPPISASLPNISLPEFPVNISLPEFPVNISLPEFPVNLSLPEFPVNISIVDEDHHNSNPFWHVMNRSSSSSQAVFNRSSMTWTAPTARDYEAVFPGVTQIFRWSFGDLQFLQGLEDENQRIDRQVIINKILSITATLVNKTSTPSSCQKPRAQCGGIGWTGPTSCCSSSLNHNTPDSSLTSCQEINAHYSECRPRCPATHPCLPLSSLMSALRNGDDECTATKNSSGNTKPHCQVWELCTDSEQCRNYPWSEPYSEFESSNSTSCSCGLTRPCYVETSRGTNYCAPQNSTRQCDSFATHCRSQVWDQCGGKNFNGGVSLDCSPNTSCVVLSEWYAQCQPNIGFE